jgi:hypothetical protein
MIQTEIVSVNCAQMLVLTNTGESGVIVSLLDDEGDKTEDCASAKAAIGRLPDGRWFSLDLTMFEHGARA